MLYHLPSNAEVIDRARQMLKKSLNNDDTTDSQGPILEIWQYTQMEKRIESAENGITRVYLFHGIKSYFSIFLILARFITSRSFIGHE